MIDEIQALINQYSAWLKDKTVLREVNDWVEITTPFLDRHNDYLQIYARRHDGRFILTDDSYTIEDLKQSGCDLYTQKRRDLLEITLKGFGVQLEGTALVVQASPDDFALRKHNLVQAMLAVNDLFYLAAPRAASLFLEDVTSWFDYHEVRYTPNIKFAGDSGIDWFFDFVIPKSRSQPERIVDAVNHPNLSAAQHMAFKWFDTRSQRRPDTHAYALLNDYEYPIQASVHKTLSTYGVRPVPWSERDRVSEELVA